MVHVRGLESHGITSAQYGSLLIPVILSKFSNDIRLRVARETNEDIWEIDKLLRKKKRQGNQSEGTHVNVTKMTGHQPQNPSYLPATASLLTISSPNIWCTYCGDEHYSAACTKFNKVTQRREILKKSG